MVIDHAKTLQPDPIGQVNAAAELAEDGIKAVPCCTKHLALDERLVDVGCKVLMPSGAPLGTGLGLNGIYGPRRFRAHFPDSALVVDTGLGLPSQAAHAMELGYDAVLLNTAVAKAGDPAAMGRSLWSMISVNPPSRTAAIGFIWARRILMRLMWLLSVLLDGFITPDHGPITARSLWPKSWTLSPIKALRSRS